MGADARLRLRVRGAVQGVGFRPFAYGLARELGLAGFVLNDGEGVLIEVEGAAAPYFVERLRAEPPPLARIDAVEVEPAPTRGEAGFLIAESQARGRGARIGVDAAICEACLNDLFDPASRFYRYPLVTCTHCGPRYTLTHGLPYDRARTSMAPFPLCEDCARDYADPLNRRFHAEPIACGRCGPRLNRSIEEAAACLAAGGIVAVKGLGGFHLICDARDSEAVERLRARKIRDAKPFAVMTLNAASAALYAEMGEVERAAFESAAAPIVLMRARGLLAPQVAPGLVEVGLMRAYTPLHWLIFHELAGRPAFAEWRDAPCEIALVATSANLAGEPLIADDEEMTRAGVADLVLGHARAIVVRADDSVLRIVAGAPAYLRRARGFAPEPIDLGADGPCLLAHGGDLKNTVTIARGREAFVSPHLGDLDNAATIRARAETIRLLLDLLDAKPEAIACDLHPNFVSSRFETSAPVVCVQHHVAHVAATAAEAGWRDLTLGVALDGFGYGADGAAWGGELIALDGAAWRRIGHLAPLALPGGDKAAREPWRMGVALLHRLGRGAEGARRLPGAPEAARLAEALARGQRATTTTSLGRLFDAAAALAGVRLAQRYEGQAAMELEALVDAPAEAFGWTLCNGVLDFAPMIARLLDVSPRDFANGFHGGLVAALDAWIGDAARDGGYTRIALGGGCLANRILCEGLVARLASRGFEVAIPRRLPANDGGLSFGQAAFALNVLRG